MQITNNELMEILNDIKKQLAILNKTINDKTIIELLSDPRVMENPTLRNLATEIKQQAVPLFYVGGENSYHNYGYRDDILAKEYDQFKPWMNESKNNSPHGTDRLAGDGRPNTEFKSMTVSSNIAPIYLYENTKLGEIDKVFTRTINDPIYGVDSDNCFFAGIFNEIGNEPIITFYVDKNDFGKTIYPKITERTAKLKQKTNNLTMKGRDSLVVTLGMFIECPSFKVVDINPKWCDKVIYTIESSRNQKLYNSIKSFIGDKEKQIQSVIGNIDGKIVYSFANRNLNEIKLYDFTIAEIQGIGIFDTESKKDLICAYYDMNNLVAVFKIDNDVWLPIVNTQKGYAKEFDDLIVGQSKSGIAEIAKNLKQKYPDMQADIIRADTCRLKSNQIKDFELLYVNPEYKNKFIIRKMDKNNDLLFEIYNKINDSNQNNNPSRLKL